MNAASLVVVVLLVSVSVDAHPAFRKKLDSVINGNPCLKQCMKIVKESDLELSVVKTVDYANYFLRLDEICSIIEKARDCIDKCGIQSNPFKLNSMTVMCASEVREETKTFAKCMKEEGQKAMGMCETHCGSMKNVSDEIETKTAELNSKTEGNNQQLFNGIMEKTNQACGMMKCFARCSRDTLTQLCADSVEGNAGEFMYNFVERVNQAMLLDLEQQKMKETMMRSMPVQCNYMHTAQLMFNASADQTYLMEFERQMAAAANAHNQPATNSMSNELVELQKIVLNKELSVLEKRERVLEKESRKLDMEIALLQGRGSF